MSDDFIRKIREQLEAIRLAVTRPTRVRAPKAKAPPKTAYGWFKRNWADTEFRSMVVDRIPSIDDAPEDPVKVYRGLNKDEKGLVRALFVAQRDGASDDGDSDNGASA